MTAKKKVDESADLPPEEIQEPKPAPKPKEKLVTVVAAEWFSDGNLQEFMATYGYECEWPMGQERSLPMWLIQRCINSGGTFDQVE